MEQASPIEYLPIGTSVIAAAFAVVLWNHWREAPQRRYLLWWTLGVAIYGVGTLTEALTTLTGWHEPLFRAWYISGALLGGAPLAQGTVYLLLKKRTADRLTVWLIGYVAMAAAFVIATPVVAPDGVDTKLNGDVMSWQWVRAFSPLINLYAVIFLVGGAGWSAWRYWRRSDRPRSRVVGNALIAVGAILPGIGGSFARFGHIEVLYVTEMIGLTLIWLGYRVIDKDTEKTIHPAQVPVLIEKEALT